MFLGISDAGPAITEAIQNALGPLASLKIEGAHVRDFLIQVVATILLFIFVRAFLWKPITNILESRRQSIDKALEDAHKAKENAIEIESNLQQELINARLEVKTLIDKAIADGNVKKEAIINEAKEEARKRLENLNQELELEKKNMEKQIKEEIVNIAFAAAEKIVAKEINQDKYLDIVDDILKGAN